MIALVDVNVLVAVAWPEHVFHDRALAWFDARADDGWATSSVTESGFIRISANAAVVGDAVLPREAAELMRDLRQIGAHEFWPDDIEPSTSALMPIDRIVGYRQVTDAHLIALARRHGGSLATLDRRVAVVADGLDRAVVEVIT